MDPELKGYDTDEGYMGWINDHYELFSSYRDYRDHMER